MDVVIAKLLKSDEPSIRYKIRVNVLGEDRHCAAIRALQSEIRACARTAALLADRDESGRLKPVANPYKKWTGAHWVLTSLADIGYPQGDPALMPVVDQAMACWLHPTHLARVPVVQAKARRCASQQGNMLFSALRLMDAPDERVDRLAQLLIGWQWPDGGWNCDRNPAARNSSFFETITPLRALALYAKETGDRAAADACARAAEVFLSRELYLRRSDGALMDSAFIKLHYPCYWHYDILFGLKVMAEAGYICDPRCQKALDLLESKRLPDGGWPAEAKYYKVSAGDTARSSSGAERVAWGSARKGAMNEWVTADALFVLRAAGRCPAPDAARRRTRRPVRHSAGSTGVLH